MKLVAMILAHKNPNQLKRLQKVLEEEGFEVFIHIDRKSRDLRVADFPNAISTHAVDWGGYSTIKASIALFKVALKAKGDYYFLLSAQDYLLQSREQIIANIKPTYEYVQWWKIPSSHLGLDGGFYRLNIFYFQSLKDKYNFRLQKFQRRWGLYRKLPADIQFFGGSQWFTITHDALVFITNEVGKWNAIYHHTLLADESIFQTILLNSPFRSKVVNDNLRLIEWEGTTFPKPKVWTNYDFDQLITSNKCFARKFHDDVQILDRLDEHRILSKSKKIVY